MIRTLFCAAILAFSAGAAFATDLELITRAENLFWSPDRTDTSAGRTFTGQELFWTVDGAVTQDLGDGLLFKGGVVSDPILRRRAYAQLAFQMDSLSLSFSPFLGTFNSWGKWFNPGMEALVEYSWPGYLFLRGGFLTTFAPVAKADDYYLSSLEATIGTMMENGILSLNIEDKSATFRQSASSTTVDASTKVWVDLEMFLKNFPLRWAFLSGYQRDTRTYLGTDETSTPLHSVLFGARLSWDFGRGTIVYVEGNSAFFQQGWDATVTSVSPSQPVFQLVSGIRYHW